MTGPWRVALCVAVLVAVGAAAPATPAHTWTAPTWHRLLQGFGVGAVIETPPPTMAPTAGGGATPGDDWVASTTTVHYRLYAATELDQPTAQAAVETLWMETLQSWLAQHGLAVSLERMETQSLGACDVVATPPFPYYTVCRVVKTTVHTLQDPSVAVSVPPPTLLVDELMPIFNHHYTEGRVEGHDPVVVTSTLTLLLHGVDTVMTAPESAFLTQQLWSIVEDGVSDVSTVPHVPLSLDQVQITDQTTSSGAVSAGIDSTAVQPTPDHASNDTTIDANVTKSLGTRRLRGLQETATPDLWNRVSVSLSATCASASTCPPDTLQRTMAASEHTYGDLLMVTLLMGNNANELYYFDDLTNITLAPPPLPTAATGAPVPTDVGAAPVPAAPVPAARQRRIPQWFWILILISISFIVASLLYVCVRQTIRAMQDESEHPDHYKEQHRSAHDRDDYRPRGESADFSASIPPTFSQVKDVEPREQYPQVPSTPTQQHNIFSFIGHKKDQSAQHKKSVQEMEDEDYDNRSYDEGEFSVDPHDFQPSQEDEYQDEQQDDYYDEEYDNRSRDDDRRRYHEEERRPARGGRRGSSDRDRDDHRRRSGSDGRDGRDEKRRGGRRR